MLSYSYIDQEAPKGIPPRSPNGGLYTGIEAPLDAKWRNFPVKPEAHILVTENLKTANPPPNAINMIPGYTRPGNNEQYFPNHIKPSEVSNFKCHL